MASQDSPPTRRKHRRQSGMATRKPMRIEAPLCLVPPCIGPDGSSVKAARPAGKQGGRRPAGARPFQCTAGSTPGKPKAARPTTAPSRYSKKTGDQRRPPPSGLCPDHMPSLNGDFPRARRAAMTSAGPLKSPTSRFVSPASAISHRWWASESWIYSRKSNLLA